MKARKLSEGWVPVDLFKHFCVTDLISLVYLIMLRTLKFQFAVKLRSVVDLLSFKFYFHP